MPYEASLLVSLILTATYTVLWWRYYTRPDSRGRVLLESTLGAIALFWALRSLGFWYLIDGRSVSTVNSILRWSAYSMAIPAVVLLVMEATKKRR